ncbi:uncharacterized protein LOC131949938 [Physella acuta]|uniref:uncharacterized protein LOC131949938 n=1 Tax=Physella acuta TaxID=109671 RepID=UPI0027DC9AB5|nr:uncharacterized protein LOC131949938 [Physella acuta]
MWNSKEPNNLNGNEHCLESHGHGKLNDMDCSTSLSFICMEVHETSQKFETTPSTTKKNLSTFKTTPSTTKMTQSTIKMIPSTSKMPSSTIKMISSTIKRTPSTNATSTLTASATAVIIDDNVTKAEMFSNYTFDSTSQKPTVIDEKESNDKFIQPTLVTFTVGLSKQLDVLLHDVIVYNKVVSNVGDDYNNSTGVFRCNMAGLYFFQIYGVAGEGKELSLSLVKNKKKVTSLYSSRNQELSLAANSAVLLLEAGDEVFVEASNCGSLYGEEHHVINTFSGFLLDASIA